MIFLHMDASMSFKPSICIYLGKQRGFRTGSQRDVFISKYSKKNLSLSYKRYEGFDLEFTLAIVVHELVKILYCAPLFLFLYKTCTSVSSYLYKLMLCLVCVCVDVPVDAEISQKKLFDLSQNRY